nr:benzyl alcohol o-benzoyltransferase [Quercus suber]
MFCRYDQSLEGKDPVKVIREAIARTLVFYYPYAGRLREGPDAKFMVECTGEGVMFIEADADVTLEEFGDAPHPPFPCVDELIFEVPVFEVPGSGGLVNCPLLLFQVTRLRCGGFALALRYNHIMSDGMSILQFMIAVGEMAQGYYGNGIAVSLALTTAGKLCQNPLEFALELIKSAKNNVTEEYVRSLIDLLVIKGPPFLTMVHSYFVSDITRTRFEALDFGLGKAAFGGPGKIFPEPGLDPANNYMPMKNSQGEKEIMVPMCLPTLAMERFVKELDGILGDH